MQRLVVLQHPRWSGWAVCVPAWERPPVLQLLPFASGTPRQPTELPHRVLAGAAAHAPALPCRQAISNSSPRTGKGVEKSPGFHVIDFAVVLISKRGIKLQLSGNTGIVCSLFMFFHLKCIGFYLIAFFPFK